MRLNLEEKSCSKMRQYPLVMLVIIMAVFLAMPVFLSGCSKKKQAVVRITKTKIPLRIIQVDSKKRAEEIHGLLEKDANFAELAKKYSQHTTQGRYGNLGTVMVWDLASEFQDAVKGLKVGEYTGVVKTDDVYSILLFIDDRKYDIGIQHLKDEEWEMAVIALEENVRQNPDHADAYHYLGLSYEELGQSQDSINAFQTLLTLKPDYPSAYNNLGNAYVKNKQYPQAIKAYSEAQVLSPNDPIIMNNLAWSLAKEKRSLDIATKLIQRAIALQPKEPQFWDTMAEVHLAKGQIREALAKVEKAIATGKRTVYFEKRKKYLQNLLTKQTSRIAAKTMGQGKNIEESDLKSEDLKSSREPQRKATPKKLPPPSKRSSWTKPRKISSAKRSGYAVQISAYKLLASAQNELVRFKKYGYKAYIDTREISGKGLFHRVRLGPFKTPDAADRIKVEIQRKYSLKGFILKED